MSKNMVDRTLLLRIVGLAHVVKMKIKLTLFIVSLYFFFPALLGAQKVAVKTNAIYWGVVAPNLGLEFATSRKFTVDVLGSYQPFSFNDNKNWKFWVVQPEVRYWFCETFNGTFIGAHLHGGEFNLGGVKLPFGMWPALRENRYDGYYYGAGVSVGHQWVLSKRWNVEASLGAGYNRIEYDKYRCAECSPKIKSGHRNYWGPTKATVSFIYFLK